MYKVLITITNLSDKMLTNLKPYLNFKNESKSMYLNIKSNIFVFINKLIFINVTNNYLYVYNF